MNRIEALKVIVAYIECDACTVCSECYLHKKDCDGEKDEAMKIIKGMIHNHEYLSEEVGCNV